MAKNKTTIFTILFLAMFVGGTIFLSSRKEKIVLGSVEELKVRFTPSTEIPDPTHIETAGQWYFLDHISSGLAAYDSQKQKFTHLLAESWSTSANGTHVFKLRSDIRFHDGTPISVKDVLWTIKRHLILKKSTHFPLWEYIVDCENLKSLDEDCEGIFASSDREISIRLKTQTDSFFLQLASPETGIWSSADMDPQTAALKPTKFSGPYFVQSRDENSVLLKRNEHSLISKEFPQSPRTIRTKKLPLANQDEALMNGDLDLVIRSLRPLGEPNWQKSGIEVQSTAPANIIYFHGTGTGNRLPIGKIFIETAWQLNNEKSVVSSETFLPFAKGYGLTRTEFLSQLPDETAPVIRVLAPEGFFSEGFINRLKEAGLRVGSKIQISFVPGPEWSAAFDDPKIDKHYDYILSSYAASERYPAVQLRYISGPLASPRIDLKQTESPDLNADRIGILKEYQKWLLNSRQAIPLYFTVTLLLHQKQLDLGDQPAVDAEVELWRVQQKAAQ